MCETLQANATTVAILLGSGTNRYIDLVQTAAAYDIITPGMPFNNPVAPDAEPDLPAGAN
jgi:hypothetical protein